MSSKTVTKDVSIVVETIFLEDYSHAHSGPYLFSYRVTIKNLGKKTVKLQSRHWVIIDNDGHQEEVKGPGVVGKFPELKTGEEFEYFSFCPLPTTFGTMEGSFQFVDEDGHEFDAMIDRYYLDVNLNEFPKNEFKRGQVVRHKLYHYSGVIVDYDICFAGDENWYERTDSKPPKNLPWYHILVNNTDKITYVSQRNIVADDLTSEINHPLLNFFFDGRGDNSYIRNQKTWADLKRS